jgi:hypothetical protein
MSKHPTLGMAPHPKGVKRPSAIIEPMSIAKRLKVVAGLANTGGISKTGLANVLKSLGSQGLLNDALSISSSVVSHRRCVQHAIEDIPLHTTTLHGPLIRSRDLPTVDKRPSYDHRPQRVDKLHFVSPLALMSYLCSKNEELYDLLAETASKCNNRFRIVTYIDEINPGNPLVPDPEKMLQAFYWTIVDLPSWFLRRQDSWFAFCLVRSKTAIKLQGGVTELVKHILHEFFPPVGDGFLRGCHVHHGDKAMLFTATFEGMLADEKGLKEVFGIKGQAGNLPCISCLNVRNRWVKIASQPDLQHHWDADLSKRHYATDAHVRAIVHRLSDIAAQPKSAKKVKEVETRTGIVHYPTGILFDHHLSEKVLHPTTNYIRDWMHTLCSNGVAGTHIALVCQALADVGVDVGIVRMYAHTFTLPKARNRGRVSDLFFKDELMSADHVRHFAGDVLGMVPLLHAFLEDKIKDRHVLAGNIECFSLLNAIIAIMRRGSMDRAIHRKLLQCIVQHNTMFVDLYGNTHAKIKFHHLMHIPDDMLRLGSCLSCFPTERKNKDALAVSEASNMDIEKTSIIAFLHQTISRWCGNTNLCKSAYLRNGVTMSMPSTSIPMNGSIVACLPCGDVHAGDMVILVNGQLASIIDFWESDGTMLVRASVHNHIRGLQFESHPYYEVIDDVAIIVEPVAFYNADGKLIAAIPLH